MFVIQSNIAFGTELSSRAVAVAWQLRLYLLAQEASCRVLGSDVASRWGI